MKAMILVLSPKESRDLLNGDLSVLVRKRFPKDYAGWVYIYCTKNGPYLHPRTEPFTKKRTYVLDSSKWYMSWNDKVVARFWCDKVEEIIDRETKEKNHYSFGTETLQIDELEKMSCLNIQELCKYIGRGTEWRYGKYGYAVHIAKVEPFDKPKELCEFKTPKMTERYKYDLEQAYEDDYRIKTRLAEGIANDDECANCVELTEWSEGYYGLSHAPRCGYCYIGV